MIWTIAVAALVAIVVAVAGGVLTEIGPWYRNLRKPSWQPPDWAFAPAWTTIFALAATAAVLGWYAVPEGTARTAMVAAFLVNGALNMAWSFLFFRLHRPDWALAEVAALWLSILVLILMLWPYSHRAGWAMVPYLVWVSFASFLNWTIVRLNRPFRPGALPLDPTRASGSGQHHSRGTSIPRT